MPSPVRNGRAPIQAIAVLLLALVAGTVTWGRRVPDPVG
jgi:phosphate/sulfate permease